VCALIDLDIVAKADRAVQVGVGICRRIFWRTALGWAARLSSIGGSTTKPIAPTRSNIAGDKDGSDLEVKMSAKKPGKRWE